MSKDKDPAFLFYPKDWIQGTAELLPEEKGVFIDLLCHHHQNGDLPNDTKRLARMVGLGHDEFLKLWPAIQPKFNQVDDRLVNRKLTKLITERLESGHRNTITGTFASLCRTVDLPKKEYIKLKSFFKIEDFLPFSTKEATERLTERFGFWLKSIANGNANGNANGIKEEGGTGEEENKPEKPKPEFTPPSIQEVKDFFKEKGFREDIAQRAFDYYSTANWHDSKGSPVKNWKQKMISNWLKDENKIGYKNPNTPQPQLVSQPQKSKYNNL